LRFKFGARRKKRWYWGGEVIGENGRLWARAPSVLHEGTTVLCRNKEKEDVYKTVEQSDAFGTGHSHTARQVILAMPYSTGDCVLHHTDMYVSEEAEEEGTREGRYGDEGEETRGR
jgi:hypothetical protein